MTTPPRPPVTTEILERTRSWIEGDLQLLDRLVDIPSHSTTPGGTEKVAEEIVPLLEDLGFTTEVVEQVPLDPEFGWIETIMMPDQHQQDLGATYRLARESGRRRILLLGDLDTSYPEPAHRAFPVRHDGNLYYGPGIADMRGGLVVLVSALRALDSVSGEPPSIEIVLSGDEQAGSLGSRRVITESAERCAVTLCVECARRGGKLMAARGHIGIGELIASGVESHAGSDYEAGVNALDFLARVIPPINALSEPDKGVLVTVTIVQAGRRRSVIPGLARAVLDIRTPDRNAWDHTVELLRQAVAQHGDGRVDAHVFAHRPGVVRSEMTEKLLAVIQSRGREIGVDLGAFNSAAAGSSAFAAEAGSVVMDGMGPAGGGLMTADEHIDVSTIPERAAILAATMLSVESVPNSWV